MAEINLGLMLKELGYEASSFDPRFRHEGKDTLIKNRDDWDAVGQAPYYATNPVATNLKYFLPVTLEYNVYGMMPVGVISPLEYEEERTVMGTKKIELPFPVMTISGKKRLVETYLTQRNGTMKELISADGYEINIRGYIIGKEGRFPEESMIELRKLYEINEPLTIHNVISNIFLYRPDPNITDKVVITELSFPETRGNKHVREYEMKLVNDAPFNLSLIK